jgi:hypothetical protein
MTDYDSAALQRAVMDGSTDFTERDARALSEYMAVLADTDRARGADDLFLVVSESGSEYLVDVRTHSCECGDATHRDVRCKHQRRVAFATGRREIPPWVNRDAIDDQLGEHVDAAPQLVATDGGSDVIVAGDDAVILDEGDDQDDNECNCYGLDDDLECCACAYGRDE